jgi:hypothetical protein
MYRQERTKESLSIKVDSTYGTSRTSIEFAQMAYLEDAYWQKKASRSLNNATNHIWRALWGIPHPCKNLAKWILLPTMYDVMKDFIRRCGSCQRHASA